MKKLLDTDIVASSGRKKGNQAQVFQQQQDANIAETIVAIPRENKALWLSAAIRTLKEEKKAAQAALIQPEAPVTPEENDELDYEIRGPEPSLRIPVTQYHKNIKFQPYKSTRPDLLVKLERFIHQHLHENPVKDQFREEEVTSDLIEVKLKHSSPKSKARKDKDPFSTIDMTKSLISQSISSSISSWKDSQVINDENAEKDNAKSLEDCLVRKQVYAEALQEYINDCTIYRPILQNAKDAYEQYIALLEKTVEGLSGRAAYVNEREQQLESQVEAIRQEQQQRVDVIQEQLRAFHQRVHVIDKEKRQLEIEATKQREIAISVKKELEDMRISCNTLTSSLSRLEDEHRTFQNLEAGRLSEINHLRSSEQKLNEEIER